VNAGLILAAGESRRMGRPKALLDYHGETFLDRLTGLLAARCSPVIVVLGAAAEEIRKASRGNATFVINPDYRRGQTSSLQCGLRSVPEQAEGVLFTLVDHPAVERKTIDALLDSTGRGLVRVPRHEGRRGHPVWFSRELIPQFLAMSADEAARDVVRSHAARTDFVDVNDLGVLADIDDPAAYQALIGASV
jgi:molybdenum cofactor cytidylyltransferase